MSDYKGVLVSSAYIHLFNSDGVHNMCQSLRKMEI